MEKHVVGAENVVVKACTVAAVTVAAVDVVDDIFSSSLLVDFLLSTSYLRYFLRIKLVLQRGSLRQGAE